MPNTVRTQSVYIDTGNPDTMNVASLIRPGELGVSFDKNDKAYQIVQLDSGCTASAPSGVVAANQLAYWKDRSKYLVTNDSRFGLLGGVATSFYNNIAGIFRCAATAGYYICLLQRGRNIAVKEAGSASCGMNLISDTSTTAAEALGLALGTAPTYQSIGIVTTAVSSNVVYASIDIPAIP